jgi:hypothetical protein
MLGNKEINLNEKRRHLYFHGEPNCGKTFFWKTKLKEYNIAPPNNDWKHFNDNYTFIIFDEFN